MKSKPIAPWQIKLIHVAANQLGLIHKTVGVENLSTREPDPYHQILSGFIDTSGQPAASCKDLNYDQAKILMEIFNRLGFKSTNHRSNQFESLFAKERPAHLATIKQLGMLMGMWVDNSREKSLESLDSFTKRITGVDKLEWLPKRHVQKMKTAIENLA